MTREAAIARAADYFDGGGFKADLARRVAVPTESQNPERTAELARYVEGEMKTALEGLGFTCRGLRAASRLKRGACPLAARRARRPLFRPRHRRQQGPAHHQYRGARRAARRARPARLQRHLADRDGRGDRLAGPARDL